MSQAEKLNTTSRLSSRRRFLAVLSAGAASAVAPAALAAPLMPVTASEVDPIFAVIAEHRALFKAWMDVLKQGQDRAAEIAGGWNVEAAIRAVLTTQPTTIVGVAALLHHVGQHECLGMDREYEDRETVLTAWNDLEDERKRIAQDFPLRLAVAVRDMAGTVTSRRIEPSEPDPIYAAIKAEREAYAAYLATDEVQSRISDQDPNPIAVKPGAVPRKRRKTAAVKAWWAEYQKAEVVHEKACQEFWAARETLLHTQPTTVVGLRAFVDHIDGPFSHGDGCEAFWDEHEMEMACPTLTAAVRSLIG